MEKLAITLEAFTYVIISLICLILLVVVIAIGFSLSFYNQISQFFGMLFYVMQLASGIILIAGTSAVLWFGSDRILSLLIRIEKYQQERAETAQERAKVAQAQAKIAQEQAKAAQAWARIEVIQSEAAINRAKAISSEIRIEQINRNRGALVVRGSDMKLIEPFRDEPEAAAPQLVAPPLQIRDVFSNMVQVYAIVGGQQTGKTYQARHVASDWLRRGVEVWVVGPKWDKGEWSEACRMFGGAADYNAVSGGLTALLAEAERRHADTSRGHKEHAPMVAVLDDWTPIVERCDKAKPFIYDATTLFSSVNIVLIFLIHADTADAWGVGRKGAALTHGFVKAHIIPFYNDMGMVDRTRTTAEVALPGTAERRPLSLESAPVSWPVQATPQAVSKPPADSSADSSIDVHERYSGRALEVAICIQKGMTKTATRKQVTGGNAEIGALYDRIKAELQEAEAEAETEPVSLQKRGPVFVPSITGQPKTNGEVLH